MWFIPHSRLCYYIFDLQLSFFGGKGPANVDGLVKYLPREFAVGIRVKNLPWLFAARICRRILPLEFVVGICRGYLPWIFVFVSESFFVYVSKSCLYGSKLFLYVSKCFLFVKFSFLTVFLFVIVMAVVSHRKLTLSLQW